MRQGTTKLYNWAIEKASSSKAPLWFGILFFLEIFLLIPLDAVMMFFSLQKRSNIILYIMIGTIASTLSALTGYLLGHFLWDLIGGWIVPTLISSATFDSFTGHLQAYENWAVFAGGLVPFPLKVLSLTAGVFHLGIVPFVTYFAAARLLRFTLIGILMAIWGEKVKTFVDKHFHNLFLLVGAKVAGGLALVYFLAR
jgi:membrane protein YqaA with SNARE-associated domain